jgi:hypothetical protein
LRDKEAEGIWIKFLRKNFVDYRYKEMERNNRKIEIGED